MNEPTDQARATGEPPEIRAPSPIPPRQRSSVDEPPEARAPSPNPPKRRSPVDRSRWWAGCC